jgi:hypothetical protein
MLRRVALVRTNVSEEPGSSFIRVTRICELGTTQAATSNRLTLRRMKSDKLFVKLEAILKESLRDVPLMHYASCLYIPDTNNIWGYGTIVWFCILMCCSSDSYSKQYGLWSSRSVGEKGISENSRVLCDSIPLRDKKFIENNDNKKDHNSAIC